MLTFCFPCRNVGRPAGALINTSSTSISSWNQCTYIISPKTTTINPSRPVVVTHAGRRRPGHCHGPAVALDKSSRRPLVQAGPKSQPLLRAIAQGRFARSQFTGRCSPPKLRVSVRRPSTSRRGRERYDAFTRLSRVGPWGWFRGIQPASSYRHVCENVFR